MTNCTVVNNSAKSNGSGITSSAVLTLRNSIIVRNAIYKNSGTINGYYVLSTFTGWDSSSNCTYYDSSLPLFTNMSAGNYTLAAGSQAIDVGRNSTSRRQPIWRAKRVSSTRLSIWALMNIRR